VTLDLATPANSTGDAAGDALLGIERFELSGFKDTFIGDGAGNDVFGWGGDDTLQGAGGNDTLRGGAGGDSLDGGSGIDTAAYTTAKAGVTLDLATPANSTGDAAGDALLGIERFVGSNFADALIGDGGANTLAGGNGDDGLEGGGGNDELWGDVGQDGLAGGLGRDIMIGGLGDDRFDFNALAESGASRPTADVIRDFTTGAGVAVVDVIDLDDIDASVTGGGNEDFVFLTGNGDAFTAEGQVRWYQLNNRTFVELNTAGTSGAEMTIALNGLKALGAEDFDL
jgi:serralysin